MQIPGPLLFQICQQSDWKSHEGLQIFSKLWRSGRSAGNQIPRRDLMPKCTWDQHLWTVISALNSTDASGNDCEVGNVTQFCTSGLFPCVAMIFYSANKVGPHSLTHSFGFRYIQHRNSLGWYWEAFDSPWWCTEIAWDRIKYQFHFCVLPFVHKSLQFHCSEIKMKIAFMEVLATCGFDWRIKGHVTCRV
jgi:hypothetical protein